MQTIEVSFVNRRKEKITADIVSLTEVPGWLVVKIDGIVVEMIAASVVRRLKFFPVDTLELVAPVAVVEQIAAETLPPPSPLLRLPTRRELLGARHVYSPLLAQTR